MSFDPTNKTPAAMLEIFKRDWAAAGLACCEEVEAAFLAGMATGIGLSFQKDDREIAEMLHQLKDISDTKLQMLELGVL